MKSDKKKKTTACGHHALAFRGNEPTTTLASANCLCAWQQQAACFHKLQNREFVCWWCHVGVPSAEGLIRLLTNTAAMIPESKHPLLLARPREVSNKAPISCLVGDMSSHDNLWQCNHTNYSQNYAKLTNPRLMAPKHFCNSEFFEGIRRHWNHHLEVWL